MPGRKSANSRQIAILVRKTNIARWSVRGNGRTWRLFESPRFIRAAKPRVYLFEQRGRNKTL
jgi:hypothetical protein